MNTYVFDLMISVFGLGLKLVAVAACMFIMCSVALVNVLTTEKTGVAQ